MGRDRVIVLHVGGIFGLSLSRYQFPPRPSLAVAVDETKGGCATPEVDRQREGPMIYGRVVAMERDPTMHRDKEAAADDVGRADAVRTAAARDAHGTAMRGCGGHGV